MICTWIGKCLIFNWNEASPYFCFYMTAVILQKKKRIFFPGWLILSKYTSDLFFPIYCVVFSWGYIAFWLSPGSTIFIACTQRPFTSCCFGREKWQPKGLFKFSCYNFEGIKLFCISKVDKGWFFPPKSLNPTVLSSSCCIITKWHWLQLQWQILLYDCHCVQFSLL